MMDYPVELIFGSFDRPICISNSNAVVEHSEDDSSCVVKHNHDTLSEILLRIDPCNLFKCIFVSKDWLSVMTSPNFRTNYLNRWKNSDPKVVGFLLCDPKVVGLGKSPPEVQLLPTSNLGRNINTRKSFLGSRIGLFISKSPKGGLLLFGGIDAKKFYVCKPISSTPVALPAPLEHYERSMANILCCSDDGSDYKVILAKGYDMKKTSDWDKVSIQTFCSWTWKWEKSTLTFSTPLDLWSLTLVEFGTLTGRGVIYWRASSNQGDCLAVWDTNGGCTSVIPDPRLMSVPVPRLHLYATTYGESPQSSLLAATCSYTSLMDSEWFTINICSLDDDKQDWRFLHSVSHLSIWTNNLPLLMSLFKASPEEGFMVVSFVPGKSDALFLALERRLFVYHFPTGKLEYVEYLKYGFNFKNGRYLVEHDPFISYHPLTLLDLGIWLSPPPSLPLPH